MQNTIKKIGVIGAGVMGAGIAAQIANSSHPVVLLDIPAKDPDRNAIARGALAKLKDGKAPALAHPSRLKFITIGNLEDDLELLGTCELVIEVIVEKLEVKHQLYDKILPFLKPSAILASNTSTIPLKKLKEKLPSAIKSRFLITHFFNPPRYMELLELVSDEETSPQVIDIMSEFITRHLGKTIIKCNDTPGFIANRIGCYLLEMTARAAIKANLDPLTIDQIFTDLLKLPSTGIFGLYDLIGHDVMKLISTSLLGALPASDDYHKIYLPCSPLEQMATNGLLGRKSGSGFYRFTNNGGKKIQEVLNFKDLSYTPISEAKEKFSSLDKLLTSNSVYAKFIKEIITRFYNYIFALIPTVTDNPHDIDLAMKLGYSWKLGPFELFEHIGDGLKLPPLKGGSPARAEDFFTRHFRKPPSIPLYKGEVVFSIDTKMNCLNTQVFDLLIKAVDIAEEKKQNLYIYSKQPNFSAGADLKYIASLIENKNFKALEEFLRIGQKAMLRLKYSSVNIISCGIGAALGGGCEILLHSDFLLLNQELKAGLVEVFVGLIPAFGGTKEMFMRSSGNKERLLKNLENILTQNKSSSADYFIADFGIENYQINMNKHYLLEEALQWELPAKIIPVPEALTLSKMDLSSALDTTNYSPPQLDILASFQTLINKGSIDENGLLEFEREKFIELAKRPETLAKIRAVV